MPGKAAVAGDAAVGRKSGTGCRRAAGEAGRSNPRGRVAQRVSRQVSDSGRTPVGPAASLKAVRGTIVDCASARDHMASCPSNELVRSLNKGWVAQSQITRWRGRLRRHA